MSSLTYGAPLLAGGPPGWVAYAVLGLVTTAATVYAVSKATEKADDEADTKLSTNSATDTCDTCPCRRVVVISRTMSPQAAQHIVDAQAAGHPRVLTLDRPGTAARRSRSLSGIPTQPAMDRDEYPPATFMEGGAGASVRHIPFSDNRSAGAQLRNQIRGAREGCLITMTVGP